MKKILAWTLVLGFVATLPVASQVQRKKRKDQPEIVVVQHVLISFGKKIPGKTIDRTKKAAAALAEKVFERASSGEEFDALVKEYTDDNYPGMYRLTNIDAPLVPNSRKRLDMVIGFGDVAFNLDVGEVGLASYHGGNSPYGWHVIKRLE